MKTLKNFLYGTILGFLLGSFLGLLLAPNSGSQTRTILTQKINDTNQQVKQAMTQRRKELEEEIQTYSNKDQ
jgi:gas vesicle protein